MTQELLSSAIRRTYLAALAAGVLVLSAGVVQDRAAAQEQSFVTIGTGGVTGVYYPTGGAICRLVNKERKRHGIRCSVESTGGSVYNLNTIRKGELDLGVVQSDWQYHAYNGTSKFEEAGPHQELRAIFSIHPEPVTIVARTDTGITKLDDLVGKRVNFGNPGSGTLLTAEVMLDALGWTQEDFSLFSQLKSAEQASALCDNKIDAFFWLVGHPSGSIKEADTSCDVVFVPAVGEAIDKLVSERSYYRHAIIPGGLYRGAPEDVQTYGVGATFVTSTDVSEDAIYEIVKAVFDNFEDFKALHPAYGTLEKNSMITDALSAPLHDGAVRYYKEAGLM